MCEEPPPPGPCILEEEEDLVLALPGLPLLAAEKVDDSWPPALAPPALDVKTVVDAIPCSATWLEKPLSLPRVPRGTPNPAESLRNTNLSSPFRVEAGIAFRFTPTRLD
jgi:hypothetical protein